MHRFVAVCLSWACLLLFLGTSCGGKRLDLGAGGASTGGGAAAQGGAQGGASGAVAPALEVGKSCASVDDCGVGLTCLTSGEELFAPSVFGISTPVGAVPGGACTQACHADAECSQFGPGAVCGSLGEAPLALEVDERARAPRYCMEGCALGAPGGASKCHGRSDFACRPFASPGAVRCATSQPTCPGGGSCFRGYCRQFACGPRCGDDSECEPGRSCEPSSGLCLPRPITPVPVGAPCDPDASSSSCQDGICLVLFDENGVKISSSCTQSCVLGHDCANGRGICRLPRFQDYVVGDVGYCQAKCSCNAECRVPGDACVPHADGGVCESVSSPQQANLPCLDGAAGAAGVAGASND